ncbi:MAG: YifB family Mg chelatase-like AAA ATPase [Clostridiales bacterium]|nr:YifB family Mg chelatase-like AAA ATPase [Clostridiales bacterium]
MVSNIISFGISGLEGFEINVETDISRGIPVFEIVGLGDISVRESRERVKTAIRNQGFDFPAGRIIINLAPANKRKAGSGLDLALAMGILSANNIINPVNCKETGFIGELSLDGNVRKVTGVLPMVVCALKLGIKRLVVPFENYTEASIVNEVEITPVEILRQAVDLAQLDEMEFRKISYSFKGKYGSHEISGDKTDMYGDFSEVSGQEHVKRALEIAASGGHNLLMMGAAGIGKTLLAKCIPGILPPLEFEEAFEVASVYSIAGLLDTDSPLSMKRPFRTLHSSVTLYALIGGGRPVKPGEISLAHKGVLFMDEMSEMKRGVLDSLRQPLEEGKINVTRLGTREVYPSDFLFIGASNPCKCGKLYEEGRCTCSPKEVQNYMSKISGPVLDRIDIQVPVKSVKYGQMNSRHSETSDVIKSRVIKVRKIQKERYKNYNIKINGKITKGMIDKYCVLDKDSADLLGKAVCLYNFSVRAYEIIIRMARTIADMAGEEKIREEHVAEAIQYRWFDIYYGDKKTINQLDRYESRYFQVTDNNGSEREIKNVLQ